MVVLTFEEIQKQMNTLNTLLEEIIGLPPSTQHELRFNRADGTLSKTAIIDLKKHFVGQCGPDIYVKQICSTLIPANNFSKTTEQYWMKKEGHWERIPQQDTASIRRWEYLPASTPEYIF